MPIDFKPLEYTDLDGISAKQLQQHHEVLYQGYVKKIKEIRDKICKADQTQANATYSDLGELFRQQAFAANGCLLHEWYFENLVKGGTKPSAQFIALIDKEWGSWQNFLTLFRACGLAARGWVVLAYSIYEQKLRLFTQDAHDKGAIWACVPLLILDVYEHAYMLDYGVKRKDYLEAFIKNINWQVIEKRYLQVRNWQLKSKSE